MHDKIVKKSKIMASKRKFPIDEDENHQEIHVSNKKHTLDSDEEDSDEYEKEDLKDSDVEGEEEGTTTIQDEVKITPFNMREELQEGHFDKDGTYHWNKDSDIRDNWLDNIDWVKVKEDKSYLDPKSTEDSNDDSTELPAAFNEAQAYAELLPYMKPKETVQRALQRLGKSRVKISSAERLRRKKLGIVDEAAEKITKFTELTNEILTKTGNMDIYQATTEQIRAKVNSLPSTSKGAQAAKSNDDAFDMYADDFDVKEKKRIEANKNNENSNSTAEEQVEPQNTTLLWEFKWNLDDTALNGPYTTEQMRKWAEEKYFKTGVYVRKVGETTNFYTSNRIDFDLYL